MNCTAKIAVAFVSLVAAGCQCVDSRQSDGAAPKVSVFSSAIVQVSRERGVSLDCAAKMLALEGVRGFDCAYNDDNLPRLAATELKPINLFGFIPFFGVDNGRAECEAFVATAKKYGVPRIMCVPQAFDRQHVESEALIAKHISGLKYLVEIAAREQIKVMIEDFGGTENACSQVKYLKRYLTEIPGLYYALDSGNLYYASRGESILEMLKFAEGRIEHVHLKDQSKDDPHRYVSIGLGGVENAQVVRTMAARGYDGWYTLENPVKPDCLEDVARQMGTLRHWLR